jgi:hypothetical protein
MDRIGMRSAAAALGIVIWACGGDSPTRPTPTPQGSPTSTVTVSSLELTGPDTVASDGGTAQFTATARLSDGASRDVTNESTWRTLNSSVLTVTSGGLATGRQRGETSITAVYGGRTATRSPVFVLPAGTYRLSGTVTDAGFPVNGARVAVTLGTGQGQTAVTSNGTYQLYGVAGPVEIGVTKFGYDELKKRPMVSGNETLDFALQLTKLRAEVGGTYTLELTAAPDCTMLPAELRTRRYSAVLTQAGPNLTVTLSGASFSSWQGHVRNSFVGQLDPQLDPFDLRFQIGGFVFYYYFYDYPGFSDPYVLEQLSPTTEFSFGGIVTASVRGSNIIGTLDGGMGIYDNNLRSIVKCYGSHPFRMSK